MYTATLVPNSAPLPSDHVAALNWNAFHSPPSRVRAAAEPARMRLEYQGAQSVRQTQKSWTGVIANMAEIRCDGSVHVDLSAADARLSVVIEHVGGRFGIQTGTCRSQRTSHQFPQPLSVIPGGIRARGRAEGMRFARHLVLQFETASLARMVEDEIDVTNVLTLRPMFIDPGIMRLSQLFAAECESDQPHSRLYGDILSLALVLALSRLTPLAPARSIRQGQLAPWQLRRVIDYLSAHLAEDTPLQALADLVKLSRSYFSRAFKVSTGFAPHQWLLQARISKAKQLLLNTDRPLAQVAIDIGFADQAHFSRTFRRATGESPGAWQRARFS